jgi:hypothetical protein
MSQTRPRFSEREGRLLLAAVARAKRDEPKDYEWRRLFEKLERHWGDDQREPQP